MQAPGDRAAPAPFESSAYQMLMQHHQNQNPQRPSDHLDAMAAWPRVHALLRRPENGPKTACMLLNEYCQVFRTELDGPAPAAQLSLARGPVNGTVQALLATFLRNQALLEVERQRALADSAATGHAAQPRSQR